MKLAPIASLLGCAALVGWLAPDMPGHDSATARTDAAGQTRTQGDERRNGDWLAGQTVLKRQPDGHFYADASIEGTQLRMLVDTGASIVALTGEDASAAGLAWDESRVQPIGRGASGPVNGVPVRIERMEIDGMEARDVPAVIIPEGLDVSLLGQSFLSRLPSVEIKDDELTLGG